MPKREYNVEQGCYKFCQDLFVNLYDACNPMIEWLLSPGDHAFLKLLLGPVGIGKSWTLRELEIELRGKQTNEPVPSDVIPIYLNVSELFEDSGQGELNRPELISWLRDCYRLANRRPNPNNALDVLVQQLVDPNAQERDGVLKRFVLLLDGYDRISENNQDRFDELLTIFMTHAQGCFRAVIAIRAQGSWTPPEPDHEAFYLDGQDVVDSIRPAMIEQIKKLAKQEKCDLQVVMGKIEEAFPSYKLTNPLINRYLLEATKDCNQTPLIAQAESLILRALARNDDCVSNNASSPLITAQQMEKLRDIARVHNAHGEIPRSQYERLFEGAIYMDPFHILIFQKLQILKLDKKTRNFKVISPFLELLQDMNYHMFGDQK